MKCPDSPLLAKRSSRLGFVLVTVIVILILGVVVLESIASRSFDAINETRHREIALQRKWGRASLENVLINSAQPRFERSDARSASRAPYPSVLQGQILLGGQLFTVRLSDENAKVNLNWLFHLGGSASVRDMVGKAVGPKGRQMLAIQPEVESLQLGRERVGRQLILEPAAFKSLGQIFDIRRMSRTLGDDRTLVAFSDRLTCFSNGGLNVKRCDDSILKLAMSELVTDGLATRIIEKLRDAPAIDLEITLEKEVRNVEDRQKLRRLLQLDSQSYSLWTEVSDKDSRIQYAVFTYTANDGSKRQSNFQLN